MKKIFLVFIVAIGCQQPDKNISSVTIRPSDGDSAHFARNDSLIKIKKDSISNALSAIKKKFIYKHDEFKDVGWYTHKFHTVDNTWNRKCLRLHVKSDGYAYLEDQYYSTAWIFHTNIEVKVGDSIYRSEIIPTYSDNNKTENSGGSIWENINYTDGQDNGIIKAIAAGGNKPVKVRFVGKQYYSDIVLSDRDKQAIRDGYQLSELLRNNINH